MARPGLQGCAVCPAVATLLAACTTGAVSPAPSAQATMQVATDVVYARALVPGLEDVTLDVYAPADADDRPAVIWVPGGNQTKFDQGAFGRMLAERGMVVFVPDIAHPTSEAFAADPWTAERMISEQAACLVREVRAIASDHGGSGNAITWSGVSLGGVIGYSAALVDPDLAATWETTAAERGGPPAQFECVTPTGSTAIDTLVMSSSAANIDIWSDVYAADPALLDFMTSTYRVGNNPGLRVRMINGTADEEAPIEAARATYDRLRAAGYDVKLTVREGVGHDRNDVQVFEALDELLGD